MKRLTNTLLFIVLAALAAAAQDFKLYYAKNVNDVTHFTDDVDLLASQLDWREVENNAIDGNQLEVYELKQVLASKRMKDLADQQRFWRMRDRTLLCFRINDGSGKTGCYNVEVNYGNNDEGQPITQSLTTSRYFFASVPLETREMTVRVWKGAKSITFRYSLYDWDDKNLYLFQLDQKRQATGDTYKMEYITSYSDAEGELQVKADTLELQATKFQSFYLPEGHTLTDVFFLTGNKKEGDVKLRLNLADIVPGVDIDYRLNMAKLSNSFYLDKHENREMVRFNWLGTGLFEKYDTLYLKLFDQDGNIVDRADIHIHRVNDKGRKVNDSKLTYLGYDTAREEHRILTYGHPAYIEIIAPGCKPTLYRYKGAALASSKIVSEDLCSAKLTLKDDDGADSDIAISDQHLRYLHDLGVVVARKGTDYVVCDVQEFDLASWLPVDTLCFMDNGGNSYPKLYNNEPIDRMAQMEVTFSTPASRQAAGSKQPAPFTLVATEIASKKTHQATEQEMTVVSASEFTNFKRDYYFLRLSLVDVVPRNTSCTLSLNTPTTTYSDFPVVRNVYMDPDEEKKKAEEQSSKMTTPPNNSQDVAKANGESKLGFDFPATFKFDVGPMKMKTGINLDFTKQTISMFLSGTFNQQNSDEDSPRLSKARQNAKNLSDYNYGKVYTNPINGKAREGKATTTDMKLKYDDWVLKESASIFDVSAEHVGYYFGGGCKLAYQTPMTDFSRLQLQEYSGSVEGGAGFAWTPEAKGFGDDTTIGSILSKLKKIGLAPDVGFVCDANIKFDFGVHSFDTKMERSMDWNTFGPFANLTISARLGGWMTLRTPKNPVGNLQFGFRGGVKAAIQGGLAFPMNFSEFGGGGRLMMLGIAEAYIDVHALIFHFSASAYGRIGKQWLWPDDSSNPFHKDFPYWLKKSSRSVGNSFRAIKAPEPGLLGSLLIGDVASNANPHFLSDGKVVINHLGKPDDYNDDHILLLSTTADSQQPTTLSDPATAALQHARSKLGQYEVVLWQQLTKAVDSKAVNDQNAVEMNNAAMAHSQIKAAFKQGDGKWKTIDVTPDDGFVDQHPVVTIQEDGKAACIYQHGTIASYNSPQSAAATIPEASAEGPSASSSASSSAFSSAAATIPEASAEGPSASSSASSSAYSSAAATIPQASAEGPLTEDAPALSSRLSGQLLLRTFDGKAWSKPTALFDIDNGQQPTHYDLVMRNDTVLVGTTLTNEDYSYTHFKYVSVPIAANSTPTYVNEELKGISSFFMNRVGPAAVVAMVYERPDSTRDVYVKTLAMSGHPDGYAGCDLALTQSNPDRVKIICDRADSKAADFAVLWTETNNIIRDPVAGNTGNPNMGTVLNASRIHLDTSPAVTYPLTLGGDFTDESSSQNLFLTDFDGHLCDDRINVAYVLSNPESGSGIVMHNEKYFTNSFESEVSYTREALLGSTHLPVSVTINNTGTSAIKAATVTINGQRQPVPGCFVPPLAQKTFTIQYPIPADFNGYMASSVEVEYANVFKSAAQKSRRGAPARNLVRQSRIFEAENVAIGDIDCNVVNRKVESGGVNTFTVELIDRSSRGLIPGTAVLLGIYLHPMMTESLTGQALTVVWPKDFHQTGGVRKAYAKVHVDGITEPISAYIVPHIADMSEQPDSFVVVDNVRAVRKAPFVNLFPSPDPSEIRSARNDGDGAQRHRVTVSREGDGIRLSQLEAGEEVRIFTALGIPVYVGKPGCNAFIHLGGGSGVFILSAGGDVFKFKY